MLDDYQQFTATIKMTIAELSCSHWPHSITGILQHFPHKITTHEMV